MAAFISSYVIFAPGRTLCLQLSAGPLSDINSQYIQPQPLGKICIHPVMVLCYIHVTNSLHALYAHYINNKLLQTCKIICLSTGITILLSY